MYALLLIQIPKLLGERRNVLAVATDCIQGSMLSIAIVFLNIAVSSLKDHLKTGVNSLEQQIMREAVAPHPLAAAAAVPVPVPARHPVAGAAVEPAAADPAVEVPAGGGQQQEAQQPELEQPGEVQDAIPDAGGAGGNGDGLAAAMAAAEAIIGDGVGVIDADDAVLDAAAPDDDDWGDVPFEELLGLQVRRHVPPADLPDGLCKNSQCH